MAYYPIEDYQEVTGGTKPEIEQKIRTLIADGWYPVGDILYLSKLSGNPTAYRQSMIKLANTDAQFIANTVAAFAPKLESITAQLATINTLLTQIEENTHKA